MIRWFVCFLSFAFLFSCSNTGEKIQPLKKGITESVYSSITIQPDSLYQAYASVHGILDKNLVEEGDEVTKGTKLIQIINSNPKINAENARLSLELARSNLNGSAAILQGIEEEINAAQLQLTNDSVNYFRQKNLWEQQIGSKVEYDAKKLGYELTRNRFDQLKDTYHRTKNELQTQLLQAENNYRTSLITTGDFTIESKIHGKIYALHKNPGEIVNTVEPLALIGSSSVFIVEMLVDEVDIVKVKPQQKVLVTLDAYKGELFMARVDKIYPKKDERNQTFVVEALFESSPEVLYPGLAGEANIIVAEKKEALIIPKEFLWGGNRVKTENGMVEIVVGLQNMDSLEVTSGINAQTWIYKSDK
ncbi:MAG: HlyD family efflux transporter periplasmic adaptor subunit [Bacteroidota bacterium]